MQLRSAIKIERENGKAIHRRRVIRLYASDVIRIFPLCLFGAESNSPLTVLLILDLNFDNLSQRYETEFPTLQG